MPTAKPGPWMETAIAKGLVTRSSATRSPALAAVGSGGAGVALDAIPEGISEATWQSIVVAFAESCGWKTAHCRKTLVKMGKKTRWETTMPAGWFDLVLARDSNRGYRQSLYFVELKVEPNTQTEEQVAWEKLMTACGQVCFLWYPKHWDVVRKLLSKPVAQ